MKFYQINTKALPLAGIADVVKVDAYIFEADNKEKDGMFLGSGDVPFQGPNGGDNKFQFSMKRIPQISPRLRDAAIPVMRMKNASLESVLSFLTKESKRLDPQRKGLSFTIVERNGHSATTFDFDVNNWPLQEIIQSVAVVGNLDYKVDGDTVIFTTKEKKVYIPPARW